MVEDPDNPGVVKPMVRRVTDSQPTSHCGRGVAIGRAPAPLKLDRLVFELGAAPRLLLPSRDGVAR